MAEQLTREDMKQVAKEAFKEFLRDERTRFEQNIGKFVIRMISLGIILILFHLAFHGKYQQWADFLVNGVTN